jgi:hypothetical protein
MPDLESQIIRWRRDLRAAGIRSAESLDELEDHLRGDIERRMRLGAGAQRAFELASESVGKPQTLRSEFQKLQLHELMSPATHRRVQHRLAIVALIAIYVGILLPMLHKHKTGVALEGGDAAALFIGAAICAGGYWCSKRFLLKA